jgi:molybdopterin synthase sulfur carrier subunit
MATVYVPTPLRRLTAGQAKVSVEANTVAELVEKLEASYPGVKDRLLDEDGKVKRFINVFVNGEEMRGLQSEATSLNPNDEVSIIPAMAGGA